jgi:aspartate aminotransferase-like enzyme
MPALRRDIDPDGLLEYSVVFTDRSLNHMSAVFQQVMRDVSEGLKDLYGADAVAIVPGGGTFAMEAVARQLLKGEDALVVRDGWFSYRWSQIFAAGGLVGTETVMKARRTGNDPQSPFVPAPIEEVEAEIEKTRPAAVFAPHVETSAGMILPDDYISRLATAAHGVGALLVLDCIASGCVWVDMRALGVDVLISAPQKGWSASPAAGLVMLSQRAVDVVRARTSSSFAGDLKKWLEIMEAYEAGGHAYHATMPTDALRAFRDTMIETHDYGFERLKAAQWELGDRVRHVLEAREIRSVAAEGFRAPGVVVSYTDRADVKSGKAFLDEGMQIAAGVPLQVGEGDDFMTFRVGLFGLDKLMDVDGAVTRFEEVLDRVLG